MPLSKKRDRERKRNSNLIQPRSEDAILEQVQPWVKAVVEKPDKMRAICKQLREKDLLHEVRYGIEGPSFDIIEEALECVK